jgi:hypothetical protein
MGKGIKLLTKEGLLKLEAYLPWRPAAVEAQQGYCLAVPVVDLLSCGDVV